MWALRVLNSIDQGQIFPLKQGMNHLGRARDAQVSLRASGVSKAHAEILVTEDKVIITDAGSRNGTFVNGTKIQSRRLRPLDKISLHDVIIELVEVDEKLLFARRRLEAEHASNPVPDVESQPEQVAEEEVAFESAPSSAPGHQQHYATIKQKTEEFLQKKVLPGVFLVTARFPVNQVVLVGVLALVTLVSLTAVSHLSRISNDIAMLEGESRALSLARQLASMNQQALSQNLELSLNTQPIERELGVTKAYLVSAQNGMIIAPSALAGSVATEGFVQRAKASEKPMTESLSDTEVAASFPLMSFDAESGTQRVLAFAVVFYSTNHSHLQFSQRLSLFVQVLFISIILGLIFYYLLLQIMQYPFRALNYQLDRYLRENQVDLLIPFHDPLVQRTVENLSSLISRAPSSNSNGPPPDYYLAKEAEAGRLVDMMGWAALAISASDDRILHSNAAFDELHGQNAYSFRGLTVSALPDPALRESISDLIEQLRLDGIDYTQHQLPSSSGELMQLQGQKIRGESGPLYFIFSVMVGDAAEESA